MSTFRLAISPVEYLTTVKSHGWFDLGAFTVDKQKLTLSLAYKTQRGSGAFQVFLKNSDVACKVTAGDKKLARQVVTNCLSLDIDLSGLYAMVTSHSDLKWFINGRFGRYLRSPTLYEDCIKIVSTANTNWRNTKNIIHRLIQNYGHNVNGLKAFPEPSRLMKISEAELKVKTKCGYRAKSFLDIADNALKDPNHFLDDAWKQLSPNNFFDRLLKIYGIGPGSASYLCRIYGKPYTYSIDSWVVKRCDELWGLNFRKTDKDGKKSHDIKKYERYLKRRYSAFREYGPSVFWFEISKYWHDNEKWESDWWL